MKQIWVFLAFLTISQELRAEKIFCANHEIHYTYWKSDTPSDFPSKGDLIGSAKLIYNGETIAINEKRLASTDGIQFTVSADETSKIYLEPKDPKYRKKNEPTRGSNEYWAHVIFRPIDSSFANGLKEISGRLLCNRKWNLIAIFKQEEEKAQRLKPQSEPTSPN